MIMSDKEKINKLYIDLENFQIPECDDSEMNDLSNMVRVGLEIIKKHLIIESKKIKTKHEKHTRK